MESGQKRTIWINAGEASGDMHGAALIRALLAREPSLSFVGMGGPAMSAAGMSLDYDSRMLSTLGFTEVATALPRIAKMLWGTWQKLKEYRPAAIILLDSPDYNFFLARMGRKLGIPVYFYISPQVWAWRKGRVNFLKTHAREILCFLPFEQPFYERHGVRAEFIGNPLMDEIPFEELDAVQPEADLVGVLPGSRKKELYSLLPEFGEAARILRRQRPGTRFLLVRAPTIDETLLRELWPSDVPVEIVEPGDRYRAMRRAELLLAASGTVSLEAALIGTPTVVAYRLSDLTFALARRFIDVKYVSLPNLILDEQVFPELLQERANAVSIAGVAKLWLADPRLTANVRAKLAGLRDRMGEPGAPHRAARIILHDLDAFSAGR
ncbi:lipid-A-disaccharide synthase [Desulfovibrio sp. X2]|uniref:lipid-A-disaccharide synthase n=1 Tax=Desulfovibrio sp. X2 TaxID=941449 RepID=UPI000358AFA2|nr:lipid-A-disaccharide synthase [Desulfovibrio sp. X2]EPR44405.1 lipid-A-disaccharide synthase [Desulfovibrio sp. X2]